MSLIVLTIELDAIRDFLNRVSASVDAEYSDIFRREEAGEFADNDELANALFPAMMSEEIAVRATLGELNALVESELQNLAVLPSSSVYREVQIGQAPCIRLHSRGA